MYAIIIVGIVITCAAFASALMLRSYRRRTARARLMVATDGTIRRIEQATMDTSRHEVFPEVEFMVAERPFVCSRWKLFEGNQVGRVADLSKLSPGTKVKVWYEPDDPTLSALIVDKPSGLGLAFLPLGIAVWFAVIIGVIWARG